MARIVGVGTKDILWKPTSIQLSLSNWDNSYLNWADLSGLKIPPLRDGDCLNYKATGTTFQNTDYTQFRFPIDLTGAKFSSDVSSLNHDFVMEISRQASNADHPGMKFLIGYGAASYTHSWQDSIYRFINDIGMTPEEVREMLNVAFAGYNRLLARTIWHINKKAWSVDPPDTHTDLTQLRLASDDLKVNLSSMFVSNDRYALRETVRTSVKTWHKLPRFDLWVAQAVPHHTVFVNRTGDSDPNWWQGMWPVG